ncbi:MAG: ABC transporter permease [Ectothiorhodospiraceae bacterium]|nr:ABC transporter permease [Ectothiorhodospiraceae bacterium]
MSPPTRRGSGILRRLGDAVVDTVATCWTLLGVGVAVLTQSLQPSVWRRTVRAELVRHLHQAGVSGLASTTLLGALAGLGLVLQALYWLGLFGQSDQVGPLLATVLVREIAPLLVGLLVIGRSVTVGVSELHALRDGGKLHTLDAMGIDPFHFLVVPRVVATGIACFGLVVAFVAAALGAGFLGASAAELTHLSFGAFVGDLLGTMRPADFALMAVKPLLIGWAVSLVACVVALGPQRPGDGPSRLLPRAFVGALIATCVISGGLSALL